MRRLIPLGILAIAVAFIVTTGFQCSSAELTSARLYIQRKDYPKAVEQLEKEVAKNPKSEEGYFLLGEVQAELKDYKKMKDAFDKALAIAPTHQKEIKGHELSVWGHLFNQGVEAINNASDSTGYGTAIDLFTTAIYVLPESTLTYRNLGLAYYRASMIDNAIASFTTAFDKAQDNLACRLLGRIYLDSATVLKSRFTDTNRDAFTAIKNLASIHEKMKAADAKYILGEPSSVKNLEPEKKKKKSAAEVKEEWSYAQYNLTLTVEGDIVAAMKYSTPYAPKIDSTDYRLAIDLYNKAVDILKKGIQLFPEDAEISENLMNSYIGAERNEEARQLLVARVKKYPDSKFDHYNLGVFFLKDSNYVDAIDQFKEAFRVDSTFDNALYNLAAAYVNWGVAEQEKAKEEGKEDAGYKEKFKLALPYLEQVVKKKDSDVQMWELLGQVYANLNQQDKAMEAYKKADEIREGKK